MDHRHQHNTSLEPPSIADTHAPSTLVSDSAELQREVGTLLHHVAHPHNHTHKSSDPSHSTSSTKNSASFDNSARDVEKQEALHHVQEKSGGGSIDGGIPSKDELDPNIVDWDGPDDPANPYNWTKGKKWLNGGFLSAMTFITPLASSAFAPGVPEVMREFNTTSTTLASFVVSIYILGYASGPLIIAPMSETFGRTPVYHVTNLLFVVFTIACAVAGSFGQLIGFRFLAGIMGSTVITIGGGTVADMFREEERGAAMAVWSIGPLLGPVVGPIIGAYLTEAKGWRWDFYLIAILAGATAIGMAIFLRETYAPVILDRKAKRLQKETNNPLLRSRLDSGLAPRERFLRCIVRPFKMLFLSPIVMLLSLYIAVIYGYLYLLFTTITEVFEGTYGFSQGSVGLAYLGIGIGMFLGLFVAGASSDVILKKLKAKNGGVSKPEFRFPLMVPVAFLIPIGLFVYGWTTEYAVHYIVPIIGTGFFGFGLIATFMPVSTYLIDAFGLYAASALAANTVFRSIAGALLPLAGQPMYKALGLGWGNSLLGFIALALIPVPVIFWRYGERIRTSPRFAIQF